jgi:hypothetical protein
MTGTSLTLSSSSADTLIKLLGMTGSDHAGECVNAARLANNLVRSLGLTWSDIITPPKRPRTPR